MSKNSWLKAVLALVCVSHLVLGSIAFFSNPDILSKAALSFYGAVVTITPQFQHVTRILGAFMIAIGVLAAQAFLNPTKNGAIIWGVIVLLLLRVSQRFIFAAEIHEHFSISYGKLWLQSGFFLSLVIALFVLRPKP